jgi:hypothetical protein
VPIQIFVVGYGKNALLLGVKGKVTKRIHWNFDLKSVKLFEQSGSWLLHVAAKVNVG